MSASENERTILRRLAEKQAAIAALPVHKTTAEQWKRLNRLHLGKPMIWITEMPWPEFADEELQLQTTDPFCREIETRFRRTLYSWEHFPGDMVVDPVFRCPTVVQSTGLGLERKERTIPQGPHAHISSHRYEPVIREEKDIEKIRTPVITPDNEATEENHRRLTALFGDVLPVVRNNRSTWWFAPWDILVTWWGVEEALTDLIARPEMVHHAMDRLSKALISVVDQHERLGLLSLNNEDVRIGSGGYGYTDELPQPDFDGRRVRTRDLWGCATAQIFSEVSPEMHWEFALKYELPWLERFGLTYYGCCEPLHHKAPLLKRIPNLRKISMSPRADIEKGAAACAGRYVFSMKPNPAVLAGDEWRPAAVRAELRANLEKTRGCAVEIIMKDISTVRNEPRRLWEWARIASEVAEEFA